MCRRAYSAFAFEIGLFTVRQEDKCKILLAQAVGLLSGRARIEGMCSYSVP